jgi:TolB protein
MRKRSLVLLLLVPGSACDNRVPLTTERSAIPLLDHVAEHCPLGLPETEVLEAIDALLGEIDALEASGSLNAGQAAALRRHLENARRALLEGRRCAARAQLGAVARQVENFENAGILTGAEADGVVVILDEVLSDTPALGRIVWETDRDGDFEIYRINPGGTGLMNLSLDQGNDITPRWSPDGQRIAFASNRDGVGDIYVMDADGSDPTRLTGPFDGNSLNPVWSPDGTRIAFETTRDGNLEVYVMNPDGTGQTNVSHGPGRDYSPGWSPDGQWLAFRSDRDGNRIYLVRRDGSGLSGLTAADPVVFLDPPAWSPDGSRVAYTGSEDGNVEVLAIDPDGTGLTNLTRNPAADQAPVWSPDGRLAFISERDGNQEVYVMNGDGSGQINLTRNPALDTQPRWSPDGAFLVFVTGRDGDLEIYVMRSDGTQQRNLSRQAGRDTDPSWGNPPPQ